VEQAEDVKPSETGQAKSNEPAKAGKVISEASSPSDETSSSLYESPATALTVLVESYHYWGEKLTDSSFALSLAVMGANWAVFGSIDQIRGNIYSELSIATILVSLAINLIGMKRLAEAHRKQIEYAEANAIRWKTEFDKAQNTSCAWPSTNQIDRLARNLRTSRTFLPLLGGAFFIAALFLSPSKPKSKSTESPQQSTAQVSPGPTVTPQNLTA
jgi:hypothetical protein